MYTLLSLFFISLFSIIFMIGRKLALVRNGNVVVEENRPYQFVPDFDKLRQALMDGLKKLVKLVVFITLKLYVKFSNFLKNKYSELRTRIKNMRHKNQGSSSLLGTETNKFLKVIGEYKNKISQMKDDINEEEKEKDM